MESQRVRHDWSDLADEQTVKSHLPCSFGSFSFLHSEIWQLFRLLSVLIKKSCLLKYNRGLCLWRTGVRFIYTWEECQGPGIFQQRSRPWKECGGLWVRIREGPEAHRREACYPSSSLVLVPWKTFDSEHIGPACQPPSIRPCCFT